MARPERPFSYDCTWSSIFEGEAEGFHVEADGVQVETEGVHAEAGGVQIQGVEVGFNSRS